MADTLAVLSNRLFLVMRPMQMFPAQIAKRANNMTGLTALNSNWYDGQQVGLSTKDKGVGLETNIRTVPEVCL